MAAAKLSGADFEKILGFMKNEITEHYIYKKLALTAKNAENKKVLERIGEDELRHYNFWKKQAGKEIAPSKPKIWFYCLVSRLFGLTFGIKLMEGGEENAQEAYRDIAKRVPGALKIAEDEDIHEKRLVEMVDEERLKYVGSIVLGLNDALVELTGALAGMTFAFQNASIIAIAGLITGIAASFSMAASEYLSTKAEGSEKHPGRAAIYTGIAYIATVFLLILPFFALENVFLSLATMLFLAVLVIFVFTFYISVAKSQDFKRHFLEMALISLGVAFLSFVVGFLIRIFLGIEV